MKNKKKTDTRVFRALICLMCRHVRGYGKCESLFRNVRCGSLQCQQGSKQPVIEGMEYYSRTTISIKSQEYECK